MSRAIRRTGFQITSVTTDLHHLTSSTSQSSLRAGLTNQSGRTSSISLQGSSSQPTSPSLKRKYISHDAQGQRTGSSSRFRVVRLTEGGASRSGRGKSYQRGRWMCTEFRERLEEAGLRRVMDSMRHAHSLDSLDMIDWDKKQGGVSTQENSYPLALPLRKLEGAGLVLRSGPPSPEPSRLDNQREPIKVQGLDYTPLPPQPRPQNFPRPLCLQAGTCRQPVPRMSQSLPSSPPSVPGRLALTSLPPPSVFSLDQTVFSLQEDTSAAGIPAIDSKIEQAMDLVKGHLKLAVREEVELLKEQIRDLQEKNQQLETENQVLRARSQEHYYTPR